MEKEISVQHTVKVGCNKEGHIKIIEGPDTLPKDVVEELLNMTADAAVQRLVEADAKDITTKFMAKVMTDVNNKELKVWRFISYVSLIVITILIAKLKGWI